MNETSFLPKLNINFENELKIIKRPIPFIKIKIVHENDELKKWFIR